jgi:tRNA pseudouridine55 synthase
MDGLLVIDKPAGPTSHDVVARARRALGERRIGHTGTLDPAASGVLPLVVGRATRLARFLSASDKSYEAAIRLGVSTDTGDAQGMVWTESRHPLPTRDAIDQALATFRGTFMQQPPAYSAKKIDGRRSYELARARARGTRHPAAGTQHSAFSTQHSALSTQHPAPVVLPSPVEVTAHAIEILAVSGDDVTLQVSCSAGFYLRSLAHDLGERLGTGAHLIGLRRTRSGDFTLGDCVALDAVERDRVCGKTALVPLARMLLSMSSVVLTAEGAKHASHGRVLEPADLAPGHPGLATGASTPIQADGAARSNAGWIRLLDQDGELLGVARRDGSSSVLHPSVVLG